MPTIQRKSVSIIKKSNELIEARYKFDIWETRVFLSVLAQIQRTDEDFQEYTIVYKSIMDNFDIKAGEGYNLLRDAVLRLMDKKVYVNFEEDGARREAVYHIFAKANLLSAEAYQKQVIDFSKQGYVKISIHPDMRQMLLQLKKSFTTYEMKHIVKLGVYSIRIYELLKQYEKIGRRKLRIDEMMRLFELTTEYARFSNFHQKIINPAIKEINKHTDLEVDTPQKIKEGRKTVALLFTFRKKEEILLSENVPNFTNEVEAVFEPLSSVVSSPIVTTTTLKSIPIPASQLIQETHDTEALYTEFEGDVVKSFGVTPFVLLQLIQNYDAELIRKQIRITKRKRGASPTTNIAGFFVNAVKTDYNDPEEAKEAKKQAKTQQIETARRAAEKKQQLQQERDELWEIINQGVNNTIRKLIANDPTLTSRAIVYATQRIQNDPYLLKTFEQQTHHFESLDMETWRNDLFLRYQLKEAMRQLEPKAFAYLSSLFIQLEELDEEIRD